MLKSNINVNISGISCALPTTTVDHTSFFETLGEKYVKKNVKMTGVECFRVSPVEQTASDLCVLAAKDLLEKLAWSKDDIGVLVFVTQFPDFRAPSTAFVIQHMLQLDTSCIVFDVNLGCSGFTSGLQIVGSLLSTCDKKKGLLLCGDTASKSLDFNEKSTSLLFGDAGAAIALEMNENAPLMELFQTSKGSGYKSIYTPYEGYKYYCNNPDWKEKFDPTLPYVSMAPSFMAGDEVFQFTITDVIACFKDFFESTNQTVQDFDFVVMHQAQKFIVDTVASLLDIPEEKVLFSLREYGNTSSASIPLTLCANKELLAEKNTCKVLMAGFGVGLSVGIVSAEISSSVLNDLVFSDDSFND